MSADLVVARGGGADLVPAWGGVSAELVLALGGEMRECVQIYSACGGGGRVSADLVPAWGG